MQAVNGPIGIDQLGVVLAHEHVFVDTRVFCPSAVAGRVDRIGGRTSELALLRRDPFSHPDNALLTDEETAVTELAFARRAGANTIVDPTPAGLGRRPEAVARVSLRTGVDIVLGTGWYLEPTHPAAVAGRKSDDLARMIVSELTVGIDGTDVRAGVIGEIGLSDEPTRAELKVLEAAGMAQIATRVPLYVHLPGWRRVGQAALAALAHADVRPAAVVLCHLNPGIRDPSYLAELAAAGAWLGFDMAGHEQFSYPDGRSHPSDGEVADAIAGLVASGFGDRILISSDVYLKIQLRRFGGYGYAHSLAGFSDRLLERGLSRSELRSLFVDNPRELFVAAGQAESDSPLAP